MTFNWLARLCFVAAFVCFIATFVVQVMIVQAMNGKRDEDKTISGIAYYFGGLFGIFKTASLYCDDYPSGKLVWLCWVLRVLAFSLLIAGACFIGHRGSVWDGWLPSSAHKLVSYCGLFG